MRVFAASAIFFALIFSASALAGSDPALEPRRISSLSIEGAGEVEIKEIKGVISEIVPPGKFFFWKPRPVFERSKVERNIEQLRQFLAGEGYYSSSVIWHSDADASGIALRIEIFLGPPVTVFEVAVEVSGTLAAHEESEIWRAVRDAGLAEGERFSVRRFKKAKGLIKNALLEMGYAKAALDATGEIHRTARRVSLKFAVIPGKLYTFGNIEIRSPAPALADLAIKNISYKTGEPVSPSKLIDTRRRLIRLGYFDSVSITSEIDDDAAVAHTVVKLKPSKTMTFQFGAGAGRVDKLRGRARFINRNFLNLNRTLEISAKASFASQGISASIRQPGIFGAGSSAALVFDAQRDDFPSYEADFLIASAELTKIFSDEGIALHLNPTVLDSEIRSGSTDPLITGGLEDAFLVLLEGGADLLKTDSPVDPSSGFAAGLDFEISGEFAGSEKDYAKAVFETAGYLNLGAAVIAKKIQAGFIKPFGRTGEKDVPLFARLFAGGSKSMRGFAFQKLGPLDSDGDPVGGNSLITAVLETRISLKQNLGAVFFLDCGNVFERSFDYKLGDLKYAVGAGLRYKVAGIPIALDFGYALNPNPSLTRYQIFLDVGHAF